jgi:hypothetical protein
MSLFDFLNAHPDVVHEFFGTLGFVFIVWMIFKS